MDYSNQEVLLQDLQNGGTAAFEYLKSISFMHVARLSKTISERNEDAEDLYSDCIEAFLKNIHKPNFVLESKVNTYLVGICKRIAKEKHKKKRSRLKYLKEVDDFSYDPYLNEEMDESLFGKIYRKSFKKLKDDCQEILNKHFDKIGYKQIAKDMGLSPMYVSKRKRLCVEALYNKLDEDPEYASLRKNQEINLH